MLLSAALGLTPVQAAAMLADIGGNAVLDLGNGASITFAGVQASAFTAEDFAIV